jgi:hypothetical protein
VVFRLCGSHRHKKSLPDRKSKTLVRFPITEL